MAYTDYSAFFINKQLLTYKHVNQLGDNMDVMYTDAGYVFNPVVTRYYNVPVSQFVPWGTNSYWSISHILVALSDVASCYFYAEVNLPQGAVVTALQAQFIGGDGNAQFICKLFRETLNASTTVNMAQVAYNEGSIGGGIYADTSINEPTIDNATYRYFIELWQNSNLANSSAFYGCIINYTIITPLP